MRSEKSSAFNRSAVVPEQQQLGRLQLRIRVFPFCLLQHSVEDTAAECEKLGATVQAFVVDCSKREEIYSVAEKVREQGHDQRLTQMYWIFGKVRKTREEVLYLNNASPWHLHTSCCFLWG